jgi:hypothetical protein
MVHAGTEVGTYLGGPRPRDELERAVPEVPGRRPGLFVVDLDGTMIGMITLDRREAERQDLGTLDGCRGGLILPRRVKAAFLRPHVALTAV